MKLWWLKPQRGQRTLRQIFSDPNFLNPNKPCILLGNSVNEYLCPLCSSEIHILQTSLCLPDVFDIFSVVLLEHLWEVLLQRLRHGILPCRYGVQIGFGLICVCLAAFFWWWSHRQLGNSDLEQPLVHTDEDESASKRPSLKQVFFSALAICLGAGLSALCGLGGAFFWSSFSNFCLQSDQNCCRFAFWSNLQLWTILPSNPSRGSRSLLDSRITTLATVWFYPSKGKSWVCREKTWCKVGPEILTP